VRLEATLAGAYRASSAKAALSALASAPPSSETRAIESALERLCLRVTDGSEPAPPAAASSEIAPSFRAQQRALLDQYCADIDRAEGSRADLERALDALGEDSFLSLQKALKAEPTPALAYQLARRTLANSPDELSMSAAAMFLDLAGELGVPPHSVDRDHPAQLGELVADVVGWVRCSELNGCGPRMAPVLSLCMNQNHCPPDADYATALRLSLSESRWEQAQWLYAQLRAARAAGARP
jgi:hypothetical protein